MNPRRWMVVLLFLNFIIAVLAPLVMIHILPFSLEGWLDDALRSVGFIVSGILFAFIAAGLISLARGSGRIPTEVGFCDPGTYPIVRIVEFDHTRTRCAWIVIFSVLGRSGTRYHSLFTNQQPNVGATHIVFGVSGWRSHRVTASYSTPTPHLRPEDAILEAQEFSSY